MYQDFIDSLKPKPKFNLDWYQENDLYSEGEIEDLVIKLIAENEPEDYVNAVYDNYSWSTYYHLSHGRKNILNWYPFQPESSVLEIGCGLGAITSVLCDRCREVTAVELSKKRAAAALLRCREKENLEIIVGNLNEIEFERKFDYITLIGVLEYQGSYTNTAHPYQDFLEKIRRLLKPQGKLLVAIENQYGLKYWCGAREDHTGIPFDGINQYEIGNGQARTFSKEDLRKLLEDSGFQNTFFYYPLPDYKLPSVIYSEKYLPKDENMLNTKFYYAPDKMTLVANEERLYKDLIKNNVFEFFANSFLVECSVCEEIGEITFAAISDGRFEAERIGTRFTEKGKVEKFSLSVCKGKLHIQQIAQNERKLKEAGLYVVESKVENNVLQMEYVKKALMEEVFVETCRAGNKEKAYGILDVLYQQILNSSDEADWENNILYSLKIAEPDRKKYGPILKYGYLDMIFRNAFFENGQVTWFDQEWALDNVPARYILYRALHETYCAFEDIESTLPLGEIMVRYNLSDEWNDYKKLEEIFEASVADMKYIQERNAFCGVDQKICVSNISKILQS